MKIIVLQGNDINKSYERLTKFIDVAKKRNWEIIYDDLGVTQSLFGNEKLIIIRDLKLITKKNLEVLDKIEGNFVIYSEKKLPATIINLLPKTSKIENFELPQLLWKFLDNMTVKGLHELIKTEPVEFVFAMIFWKLKKKYIASPTPHSSFLISRLAEIDYESKTGKVDLLLSLDLFIAKELK